MATFLLQVTTISTFLISYLILLPFATAILPTAFIRDENGELMLNGGTYYMLRSNRGSSSGGLTVAANPAGTPCPLYLTLVEDESPGIPVKITSHINSKYLPFGTTDFTLVGVSTTCNVPLVWQLSANTTNDHQYVAVGTQSNEPSAFSLTNTFNYEAEWPWRYNVNFCSNAVCGRVIVMENSGLLGVEWGTNLAFRFRKASVDSHTLNSVI